MNKNMQKLICCLNFNQGWLGFCERWWFTSLEGLILRDVPNILEPMKEFTRLHCFLFPRAPIRFSGIQMIHVLGGFHRQSNPQHRDQAQWPQSQEAQLCSQTNTHPLRERGKKYNIAGKVWWGQTRKQVRGGSIWTLESNPSLTFFF